MSTLTSIQGTDLITSSRADINNNFTALNNEKIETSVIDTDTTLASDSDTKIPSQKAVKAYVDGGATNASETTKGPVEEATDTEVTDGTSTGTTGAKLFITPPKLQTYLGSLTTPVVNTYLNGASPATWTKPAGLKYIVVEVQAGGGGGGGSSTTAGSAGAGGAGGGFSRKKIDAGALGTTETVTIGAGGTAGSNGTGGTGGTSSFGILLSATGGAGGTKDGLGGTGGVGSSGDLNTVGSVGGVAFTASTTAGIGGNSFFGGGGLNGSNGAGSAGGQYGGGGGGGARTSGGGASVGGVGANGIVIVTEHYV